MKFPLINCVVLSVVMAGLLEKVTSDTVSCEKIEAEGLGYGEMKACKMQETTTIISDDFVISSADASVQAINFHGNRKIQFLPIRVAEIFPNLKAYYASYCSLKVMSNKNFKNLKELTYLHLGFNQIERINSDTFKDATSLKVLGLHDNNIKQINGAVFKGFNRLIIVNLRGNVCIQKYFYVDPTAIATLSRKVTEKCGFAEEISDQATNRAAMKEKTVYLFILLILCSYGIFSKV